MNWLTCTRLARGMLLVAAVTATPAQSQEGTPQDWAGFRGPNLDLTVSDPAGIESGGSYQLEVVWRKHLGDGYSAISISEGIAVSAFADAENNYVGAFDADSGEPLDQVAVHGGADPEGKEVRLAQLVSEELEGLSLHRDESVRDDDHRAGPVLVAG